MVTPAVGEVYLHDFQIVSFTFKSYPRWEITNPIIFPLSLTFVHWCLDWRDSFSLLSIYLSLGRRITSTSRSSLILSPFFYFYFLPDTAARIKVVFLFLSLFLLCWLTRGLFFLSLLSFFRWHFDLRSFSTFTALNGTWVWGLFNTSLAHYRHWQGMSGWLAYLGTGGCFYLHRVTCLYTWKK